MEFCELEIAGLFEIIPGPHFDERGFFMRAYDIDEFRNHGVHREWVQAVSYTHLTLPTIYSV